LITITVIQNVLHIKDGDRSYVIRPPFFSIKKRKNLKKRSTVIGLVGPRGSGKSVGGARLAIVDSFLNGITNVWSNMDIGFILNHKGKSIELHSNPIHKLDMESLSTIYNDGLIFMDEVNMEIADSRRSNARETLNFDYVVQQLRKRRLNIIWTAQSELHVETRLRNQTDIFIKCSDVSIANPYCGIGELSKYICYDYSGMINDRMPDNHFNGVFEENIIWNKPWWNSFSTWQLQGMKQEAAPEETEKVPAFIAEIEELIRNMATPAKKQMIWAQWRIRDLNEKKRVSQMLNDRGIISTHDSRCFVAEENYQYA
jgi:hypothetical protein